MLPLPETLPKWYTVEDTQERGWTPETKDIIEGSGKPEVIKAWKNDLNLQNSKNFTVRLDRLQIISPIQVGGGSVFEGGILPAQIGGVPCIPGSSIRGALLKWIKAKWEGLLSNERDFWQSLITEDLSGWRPRQIRFESIFFQDSLKPFPLHAQQNWQVFNEKSKHLSIQWQLVPEHPPRPNSNKFSLQVLLKNNHTTAQSQQKQWLETRLKEMLQHQGIGRGTASGFGRLAASIPSGNWQIRLTGMKPCVQQQDNKKNQWGKYRWSPQVLRANLRGYFTRLALSVLGKENALELTKKIFGGLNSPAKLILTSYLLPFQRALVGQDLRDKYTNIPAQDAHSTWLINVDCHSNFQALIGALLNLASRLGGLGAGWRRPPHELERFRGFRGSEFTVTPANLEEPLNQLINRLQEMIRNLAQEYGISVLSNPVKISGSIISIWQGKTNLWEKLVHGVCRSADNPKNPNPNRPCWCGNSEDRPSGYAVRQHEDFCLVTVFDPQVEATLNRLGFQPIWC
ncbi:RAMP superfamily CRISPR-associated protein [Scytonema sp. PCC 10023]|uniref:RAMP superfamily CRISPR-associated protein n=1 Tax=Scytonema sp. PCC 10023 TaxID=1680591 RepID=UPI0039C63833